MTYEDMYRQVDTPTLVSHFAKEVNAAELIPAMDGKHLLTKQSAVEGVVEADITIKTSDGAGTAYVSMTSDVWDALPKLPDDFFGVEFGDGDDDDE